MVCGDKSALPLSSEALSAEAGWMHSTGWTPIEFLTHTYRNPWQKMSDRISAARAALDYAHRKLPQSVALEGPNGSALFPQRVVLEPDALTRLSDAELDALMALLAKLGVHSNDTKPSGTKS
jgi:hypothetical protein